MPKDRRSCLEDPQDLQDTFQVLKRVKYAEAAPASREEDGDKSERGEAFRSPELWVLAEVRVRELLS